MKKEKAIQNLIIFSFIIFNVYYAYRYLFRYNSTMTSPTYTDTPMTLQIMKYAIAFLIVLVLIYLLITGDVKIKLGTVETIILAGTVFCLVKSFLFRDIDFFIRNFVFLCSAYAITFVRDDKFQNRLIVVNKLIFLYHIIYSVIQIVAYFLIGRLPALAYAGGLVRFGGGWDDPNAFAFYLLIPTCYSLNRFIFEKSRKKQIYYLFIFFLCIALEFLTFSFSGYLVFLIAAFFMLIRYRKNLRLIVLATVCIFGILVALFVFSDKIAILFAVKGGSLAIHFEALKLEFPSSFTAFFFGSKEYMSFENLYNILLTNFGMIYFIVSVGLKLYFVIIAYKVQKYYRNNPLYFIGLIFLSCMLLGQAALPYSLIFPINYIYWSFAFLFLRKYREIKVQKKQLQRRVTRYVVEAK